MRSLLLTSLLFVFSACSVTNNRKAEFAAIEMGMVKSEVLEVAGPPHWSDRWKGHDRWIYYMVPEDRQTERVVYFRGGKVVLTGERIKPLLTAEEMDSLKEPRLKESTKNFQPSMNEEELRKAIKKEIEKEDKKKPKPKFEKL